MSLGILPKPYDGGYVSGARWLHDATIAPGMLAYVDSCDAADGLFTLKLNPEDDDRPLGVVTHVLKRSKEDVLVQVQTDGTITLHGIEPKGARKQDLAVGNSISWDTNGGLLDNAPMAKRIGYILHATDTSVRILITH